jgi:hypothetical protein
LVLQTQILSLLAPIAGIKTGEKKWLSEYPDIVSLWHGTLNGTLTPAEVKRGSTIPVWLLCGGCQRVDGGAVCGERHAWKAAPLDLTRRGGECPKCKTGRSGSQFCLCQSVGRNSRLLADWADGTEPLTVALGSNKQRFRWKCAKCGEEWKATPLNRRTSGCPKCAKQTRKDTRAANLAALLE